MIEYMHIGRKIEDLLDDQHKTKRDLALDVGMSPSNAVYLTTRESIDVRTLHKIGMVLKYNFFKHFPIEEKIEPEPEHAPQFWPRKKKDEKDIMIDELKGKNAEQEKLSGEMKRDLEMLRLENGYLKEINGLLKGKD